eukprot:CAMPEP_0173146090 /NCGR_PEP_ID=MMETSP1105-20130129/8277_1 /TAXON_ID=2985 /ORGANISM="Ochromonas sp., Strain BG-1" /LENGTH=88 /DNA_ID=CAMNT_0014060207 /DNA_START=132 /DNA_END=399 /DNA_ORIENTATION=-
MNGKAKAMTMVWSMYDVIGGNNKREKRQQQNYENNNTSYDQTLAFAFSMKGSNSLESLELFEAEESLEREEELSLSLLAVRQLDFNKK